MTKDRRSGRARNLILSRAKLDNRLRKWIQGTTYLPDVEQTSQIFLEQRDFQKSTRKTFRK